MPTAHRPQKEYGKQPQQLLERFITAIDNENLPKVRKLLREIEKSPPEGLWMHSALATALKVRADNQIEYINCLLESPLAPQDTKGADFIITAIKDGAKPEVMKTLLKAGFCPRQRGCKFLFALVERGGANNLDTAWLHPHHLHEAEPDQIIRAAAAAICQDASAHWIKTLATLLPDPVPTHKITRKVLEWTIGRESENKIPSNRSLEWAERNQWFSKEEAEKLCATLQKGYGTSSRAATKLGAFIAYLNGETIAQQTPEVSTSRTRKHRL